MLPEPNQWDPYQDFGHSHWHNSLIWGENLENISIIGPGRIDGKGLTRGGNLRAPAQPEVHRSTRRAGDRQPEHAGRFGYPGRDTLPAGSGNKAIALKLCRNVILRDFSISQGGHFGILATGVDNLTIDNLKIDTNRDGIDIDCCRNVRISNCSVNSPCDDGICPKSSLRAGRRPRHRERHHHQLPGQRLRARHRCSTAPGQQLLDGARGRAPAASSSAPNPTAASRTSPSPTASSTTAAGSRSKPSTARCCEDITISNITMNIANSPIFMRLRPRSRPRWHRGRRDPQDQIDNIVR